MLTALTGVLQGFAGPTRITANALFSILAGLTTIHTLILGIWLFRKTW